MALYTSEPGRVKTTLLLGNNALEFELSPYRTLSDEGRTSDAVRCVTYRCSFSADLLELLARKMIASVPSAPVQVEYRAGIFFAQHVTAEVLEDAVVCLVNIALLFYGFALGMCRALWDFEEYYPE